MAEESEAGTLVPLTSLGASFAKQRLEGIYKKSTAVSEFPHKVAELNSKVELWHSLLKRFRKSEEDELILPTVAAIEEAHRWLEREEERLLQMQAACCLRRKCASKVLFPDELTNSFQSVIDAIEGVPLNKTAKEEALEALEKARQRRNDSIPALPFDPDKKYVPLVGSFLELKMALEAEDGFQVVTLYGGPGIGKSMMAQYLALQYQSARLQAPRESHQKSPVQFPDGVFYLDCGPDAESRAKHLQLLQSLASRPEEEEEEQIETSRSHSPLHGARIQFAHDNHNRLCERLSGLSVLIILDDVWNQEIVHQLLVPEKSVKYMLISRNQGIWEDALHVKMAMPSLEDARKILVNYVGGEPPGGEVAVELQVVAEDVIKASNFHPLVLANWGTALNGERSSDPAEWRAAKHLLFDVVEDIEEEESFPGPLGFGKSVYPKLVVASTVMAIDVLSSEAQSLLLLATLFAGPYIPEQVLRIFSEIVCGYPKVIYLKWRTHWEDRSFIQVQAHGVPWSSLPVQTFSVNRSRQYFIRKLKKNSINLLVQSILGENSHSDHDLVVALSAMYGVEELRARAANKLGVDIKQNVSVWRCVEPFIWLLEIEGEEAWEQQCLQSAKEVIFLFIRKGRLAHNGLLNLLQQSETSAFTCWAVEMLAWTWSTLTLWGALADNPQRNLFRWTSRNKGAILAFAGVLELLTRKDLDDLTQKMAANALVAFAWASHDINLPVASKTLSELVNLLATEANAIAQEAGARAFGRLAHLKGGRNSQDINTVGAFPGVVEGLVRLLVHAVNLSVQTAAVEALCLLACDRSNAGKLLGARGALQKLADFILKDTQPQPQEFAVLTLYNLSRHVGIVLAHPMKDSFVYLRDRDSETTVSSSVKGGSPMVRPSRKSDVQGNSQTMAFPGMLRGLVRMLRREVKPVLQMLAVSTLKGLAAVEVNRPGIAKFPGALEGLAQMLVYSQDVGPYGLDMIAQAEAAETLGFLAEVDLNIKQLPGAVEGLRRLLAVDVPPYVQENAARCLTIIDPIRANQVNLHCGAAHRARAAANIHMGLFHQALADLDKFAELGPQREDAFHEFRFVKAMLGDYDGSLAFADQAIQKQPEAHFDWAERGVLKRMMGDMEGALADLDRALELSGDVYDYLKQRAFVKFLIGDDLGARSDIQGTVYLDPQSQTDGKSKFSLSEQSVAFLGHTL